MSDEEQILAKLLEAVRTGWHCSVLDGPEEPAAISPSGFDELTRHGLWPQAMRAIAEIENPHPRARRRFLRSWSGNGWKVRGLVGDDDVYFKALRVLFPPYRGGSKVLYRGQLAGMWVGPSWTSNYMVAEGYAFDGVEIYWPEEKMNASLPDHIFRIPRHLMRLPLPERRPVILRAKMRTEIISGRLPERDGPYHEEYIVDPRGLTYESFGVVELPDPRI